jgi:hypothetical protein
MSKFNTFGPDMYYSVKQAIYTTPGLNTFVVPPSVNNISVCVLGAGGSGGGNFGGGGGGGGLAYVNNLSVTPGSVFKLNVGLGGNTFLNGSNSWFANTTFLYASGGTNGATGTGHTAGGGGGAAGYSGNGGNGGYASNGTFWTGGSGGTSGGSASGVIAFSGGQGGNGSSISTNTIAATIGSGGAGAGGYGSDSGGQGGGGIFYIGQSNLTFYGNHTTPGPAIGADGSGQPFSEVPYYQNTYSAYGSPNGGSGGFSGYLFQASIAVQGSHAGYYGGGAGGNRLTGSALGANGFVYIVWGASRSFPTANLSLQF